MQRTLARALFRLCFQGALLAADDGATKDDMEEQEVDELDAADDVASDSDGAVGETADDPGGGGDDDPGGGNGIDIDGGGAVSQEGETAAASATVTSMTSMSQFSSLNLVTGNDSNELSAEDAAMDSLAGAISQLSVEFDDNDDVLWCTECDEDVCVCASLV